MRKSKAAIRRAAEKKGWIWRNRIVGHGMATIEEIQAHPDNWPEHPTYQRAALAGVLEDVGLVAEILINRRTGRLLDGHLRVALAMEKGIKEIPARYVDVSEAEELEILATLDPIASMAEANGKALQGIIDRLDKSKVSGSVIEMWEDMRADLASEKATRSTQEKVNGEAVLLDQAVQLRPEREYIVIQCADDNGAEWMELQEALTLKRVRRGGYRVGNEFDDIGVERVIPARRLLDLLKKVRR